MPIFKAADKLILYAHVPKCGGSAVSWYLRSRFGQVAFSYHGFTKQPELNKWSRTSPQHIDRDSLGLLFPDGFFDVVFSIVRHPVARLVSAYHFQVELEKTVSAQITFSDWLLELEGMRAENPFLYDNHVRPMTEIVPDKAHVFYMEHGLDQLVPWFDDITGTRAEPRVVPKINEKNAHSGVKTERVRPSDADLAVIERTYAADFERFGYSLDSRTPDAPAPTLSPEILAERDAALKSMNSPSAKLAKLQKKILRKLG